MKYLSLNQSIKNERGNATDSGPGRHRPARSADGIDSKDQGQQTRERGKYATILA
jgi:hypothetical protein